MFNALHFDVTTKYRIHDIVQFMGIFNLRFKVDLLSFGTFGLNIVLPKVPFLFASRGTS